ncbi:MAG TPA: diguanylate phosphodiesterase, partial [Rheinheimera sp.]|nr:diguanylate phosphodiesterase [Rheinheimera sp.]
MKDVNLVKPQGMDSLGRKFALVVFLAIVIAGFTVGYVVLSLQESITLEQQQQVIKQQAARYARQLDHDVLQKEQKAISANQVVARSLGLQRLNSNKSLTALADGSIRVQDDFSGAFVAADAYTARTAAMFERTALIWQQLSPLMLHDFFNFYFIAKEQFIRISPSDWAMQVEVSHDFHKDLFYQIATPEKNPARQPRWTPVYYDDIWQKWMTSLIIPVYINDEFIGVTGSDYILDDILEKLPMADNVLQGSAFLFD